MTFDIDTQENFKKKLVECGATPIGSGRHRYGYRRKNVVYKIPRSTSGVMSNEIEYKLFKKCGNRPMQDGTLLARCKLLSNSALVMEYLEPPPWSLEDSSKLPTWTKNWDWNSKGAQVGVDKRGRVRIFDYAE